MNQFDKVVCICDYTYNTERYVTKDKHYVIIDKINALYNPKIKILNDVGLYDWYFIENRFITLEEYRNEKLESIGI